MKRKCETYGHYFIDIYNKETIESDSRGFVVKQTYLHSRCRYCGKVIDKQPVTEESTE